MPEQEKTPLSTADVKRRYSWGMAPHKSIPGGMYTVAAAAADFDRWLAAHDAEVRADERAKRPDREQIAKALFEVRDDPYDDDRWEDLDSQQRERWECDADAVLALEPEAREEKPPVYLASDLWYALRLPDEDAEFDGYYERNGWADTWSNLLAEVRLRSGARPCGQDADGEPCVLMTESHLVHYGASDVGSSEPLPAPEAREVTDTGIDAARAVITALAPYNMELRPDGSEDREAAAYVSGVQAASDAIPEALEAAREVSRG